MVLRVEARDCTGVRRNSKFLAPRAVEDEISFVTFDVSSPAYNRLSFVVRRMFFAEDYVSTQSKVKSLYLPAFHERSTIMTFRLSKAVIR